MTKYTPPESSETAMLDMHRWLFEPQLGYAPRAVQLDSVMKVMRGGKLGSRAIIWIMGGALAVVGGWNTIMSALEKFGGAT